MNENPWVAEKEASEYLGEFQFPRQKSGNRLCISDFFADLRNDKPIDFLPMQAVTMGSVATEYAQQLFNEDKYSDYLFFHGLTVQLAEALAEYSHSLIRKECGFEKSEPGNIRGVLAQKYMGCRYSFGYPACPNVSDSRFQLKWLGAERINLSIDERLTIANMTTEWGALAGVFPIDNTTINWLKNRTVLLLNRYPRSL